MTGSRSVAFTFAGYSPADGLGDGEWVAIPNSGGVMRWVGEKEMKQQPRGGQCVDCDTDIAVESTRCRSCAVRHVNARREDDVA